MKEELVTVVEAVCRAQAELAAYLHSHDRNAELAIINAVQDGLARKLDFQGIVDLVGEKVGETFQADTVAVVEHLVAIDHPRRRVSATWRRYRACTPGSFDGDRRSHASTSRSPRKAT